MSPTDKSFLRQIVQTEIDAWFDTSVDPSNPDVWLPRHALTECYIKAREHSLKPIKEETKQADIEEGQTRQIENAARQTAASMAGSSAAGTKRVASTEEPRGSEDERAGRLKEKSSRDRLRLLARRCKLEEELSRIQQELKTTESLLPGRILTDAFDLDTIK